MFVYSDCCQWETPHHRELALLPYFIYLFIHVLEVYALLPYNPTYCHTKQETLKMLMLCSHRCHCNGKSNTCLHPKCMFKPSWTMTTLPPQADSTPEQFVWWTHEQLLQPGTSVKHLGSWGVRTANISLNSTDTSCEGTTLKWSCLANQSLSCLYIKKLPLCTDI